VSDRRRRTLLLGAVAAAALPGTTWSQADWRRVAVPAYSARDVVDGFMRGHAWPAANAWRRACAELVAAIEPLRGAGNGDARAVALVQARSAWVQAMTRWARLAAVAVGPLLTRRSGRRVDFPARTPLVERAIAAAPSGEAAMERIGSAAKGLPALEWMLWSTTAPRTDAEAHYAFEAARDVQREAIVLADAFATHAPMDDDAVSTTFAEIVNQWIGGLEQLRMQRLLRPVEEARARGRRVALLVRPWSGADAADRAARWQALRDVAVFAGPVAPGRGQGSLVPIETMLRGRGLNPLADRLARAARAADLAVQGATGNRADAMRTAARTIGAVRHLAETGIAPALDVRVGFSDADGD
jgi:hypothetical protein